MKRTALLLCMLLLLIGILPGCNQSSKSATEAYRVLVFGYSDSIPSIEHEVEYEFADFAKYDKQKAKEQIEYQINGKNCLGKYQASDYRDYNYYPVHRYTAEDGFSFEIDAFGTLVSCFWGTTTNNEVKTKEECVDVAKHFLSDIADIENYDITVTVKDHPNGNLYSVEFTKFVNGVKTADSATVDVQQDGALYSYSSFMLGKVQAPKSRFGADEIKQVKASLNAKLDEIYKEAKKNYSRIDYGEPDIMLTTLKDGTTGVICTVNVSFVDVEGPYESSVSERIRAVVMIGE